MDVDAEKQRAKARQDSAMALDLTVMMVLLPKRVQVLVVIQCWPDGQFRHAAVAGGCCVHHGPRCRVFIRSGV